MLLAEQGTGAGSPRGTGPDPLPFHYKVKALCSGVHVPPVESLVVTLPPPPSPPLPQMIELLDHIPRSVACSGRYARDMFTRDGHLRHIKRLNYWSLDRVLEEKYKFPREEVRMLGRCARVGVHVCWSSCPTLWLAASAFRKLARRIGCPAVSPLPHPLHHAAVRITSINAC